VNSMVLKKYYLCFPLDMFALSILNSLQGYWHRLAIAIATKKPLNFETPKTAVN